jgi:hypothetical protein
MHMLQPDERAILSQDLLAVLAPKGCVCVVDGLPVSDLGFDQRQYTLMDVDAQRGYWLFRKRPSAGRNF